MFLFPKLSAFCWYPTLALKGLLALLKWWQTHTHTDTCTHNEH